MRLANKDKKHIYYGDLEVGMEIIENGQHLYIKEIVEEEQEDGEIRLAIKYSENHAEYDVAHGDPSSVFSFWGIVKSKEPKRKLLVKDLL